MMDITLSRKELYNLVWQEPLSRIAKRYKISDFGLRKICIRNNIPLPRAGHWQRVRFGKVPTPTHFPSVDNDTVVIQLVEANESDIKSSSKYLINKKQKEIESSLEGKLAVSQKLSKHDPLILGTFERQIAHAKRDYDSKIFKTHPFELDVQVTPKSLNRGLRFLETLFKVLKSRNHKINADNRGTWVSLYGEDIQIRLREKNKAIIDNKGTWPTRTYEATGILYLGARINYSDKIWSDGAIPLESQLSRILAYLEHKAELMKIESEERAINQAKREKELQRKKEFEAMQDEELIKFKELLRDVSKWQELKLIRNYLKEFESFKLKNKLLTSDLIEWIKWARLKAAWYDPMVKANDNLLNDLDKETLKFKTRGYFNH